MTATEDTVRQTQQLLDEIATQEEAVLTFNASDMELAAQSDASYLSKPKACSRAGGHFFIDRFHNTAKQRSSPQHSPYNKHVMSSATEAELATLYIMAR